MKAKQVTIAIRKISKDRKKGMFETCSPQKEHSEDSR